MEITTGEGTTLVTEVVDPFAAVRELQEPARRPHGYAADRTPEGADASGLAVLDDPRLVLSEQYIGTDRRRRGGRASFIRRTYLTRRRLLRLDVLIVLSVLVMIVGAVLLVTSAGSPSRSTGGVTALGAATAAPSSRGTTLRSRPHTPTTAPVPSGGATVPAAPVGSGAAAPTSTPVVAPTAATAASTPTPTATPPAAAAPAASDPTSPEAMGAAALDEVRYPWQQIPGYSIVFRPIADAPSAGFYGNTDFTWGQTGGTSTLYVYPGETVAQLAGIIGFEIGHEVDAAYVEPAGGHDQIAALLGVHPASWAPECDCAEQGYLSGWYAAAFSDYWSPGVGNWSTLAPAPSGALLAAMEPWLDPRIS